MLHTLSADYQKEWEQRNLGPARVSTYCGGGVVVVVVVSFCTCGGGVVVVVVVSVCFTL